MSSKENHKALVEICHTLAAEGLTPGVGLLRGRAPFKVSVLDAIEAIKVFNQNDYGLGRNITCPVFLAISTCATFW